MVKQILYRVGQVGKELGASSYTIRRLCEAGLIDAEFSGRQWQIPGSEVERLKRDGVPAVPKFANSDDEAVASAKDRPAPPLLADPSPEMIAAAEEAEMSGRELTVAQNRLEQNRVRREQADIEDFFTDRQKRLQQQEAEELKRYEEQLQAEALTQRNEATAERRREFFSEWVEYALQRKPSSAPDEVDLNIHGEVLAALAKIDTNERDYVVRRLVDAAVQRGLQTWKAGENKREAIEDAFAQLPYGMRWYEPWKGRAAQVAAESLKDVRPGASKEEMAALARTALHPLVAEFEHAGKVEETVNGVRIDGASHDELCEAREAVREALDSLPHNSTTRQIAKTRDQALAAISAHVAERIAREEAQRQRDLVMSSIAWRLPRGISDDDREDALAEINEALDELADDASRVDMEKVRDGIVEEYQRRARRADEKAEQKSRLVQVGLNAIHPYAERMLDQFHYEESESAWSIETRTRPEVRKALEGELTGRETEQEVRRIVGEVMRAVEGCD